MYISLMKTLLIIFFIIPFFLAASPSGRTSFEEHGRSMDSLISRTWDRICMSFRESSRYFTLFRKGTEKSAIEIRDRTKKDFSSVAERVENAVDDAEKKINDSTGDLRRQRPGGRK